MSMTACAQSGTQGGGLALLRSVAGSCRFRCRNQHERTPQVLDQQVAAAAAEHLGALDLFGRAFAVADGLERVASFRAGDRIAERDIERFRKEPGAFVLELFAIVSGPERRWGGRLLCW